MHPIHIIPWATDFIPALADFVVRTMNTHGGDLSKALVIAPHHRPGRYLRRALADMPDLPKPCLLPETVAVSDFLTTMRRELSPGVPPKTASRLDRSGILFDVVADVRADNDGLLARLPLDREHFLPWGIRLATLFEECFRQDIAPRDMAGLEGEVLPFASALLENIGALYERYVGRLDELGLSTPGLAEKWVADHAESVTELLKGRIPFITGFYALAGSEERLFLSLMKQTDAHVVWHTAPEIAEARGWHHAAAREHRRQLKRWGAQAEVIAPNADEITEPDISFVQGHDRHSQLAELEKELEQLERPRRAAIVLPETGLLQPVLHHLPREDVNISMGYPLNRTALHQLLETILELRENSLPDKNDGLPRYHWRDLVTFIRHPYIKALGPEDGSLGRLLHAWERDIRTGGIFTSPMEWTAPEEFCMEEECGAEAVAVLEEIRTVCLNGFAEVETLSGLASAVRALVELLRTRAERLWQTHLIDAECLARLRQAVLPELSLSLVSNEPYPTGILFSVFRSLLDAQRVSFEPEPLTGLQVMGMLETRLLTFDTLFILDANEDKLPGGSPYDPLLPDSLRSLFNLPDSRERDDVAAYNFYRLLAGAKKAVLFYRSGEMPGGLDSISARSRFVEQLLWKREQAEKQIITPSVPEKGQPLPTIRAVTFPVSPIPPGVAPIPKTDAILTRLRARLTGKPLSPSAIDTYVRCPKSFFYKYLTSLCPADEVNEDADALEHGTIIHETLQQFLTPHIGESLNLSQLPLFELQDAYSNKLQDSSFFRHMSYDKRIALEHTGRERLALFLENQGVRTIVALEQKVDAEIEVNGLPVQLTGIVDRIDEGKEGLRILDYKTGSLKIPKAKFWTDEELWDAFRDFSLNEPDVDPLRRLRQLAPSLQLPVYLFMQYRTDGQIPEEALWVELAKEGEEKPLFGPKFDQELREEAITDLTPRLLQHIIGHMLSDQPFAACPGRLCQYCEYKAPCGA